MARRAVCPECSHEFTLVPKYTPLSPHEVQSVLRELELAGDNGMTDDELDEVLGWGHQTTSATTTRMRYENLIRFKRDGRKKVQRTTRKGCMAGVNEIVRA